MQVPEAEIDLNSQDVPIIKTQVIGRVFKMRDMYHSWVDKFVRKTISIYPNLLLFLNTNMGSTGVAS